MSSWRPGRSAEGKGEGIGSGVFNVLREVKESFVLPVTVLPITNLLLKVKDSFAGRAAVTACKLRGVLKSKAILRTLLAVVGGIKDTIFSGLPLVFTINITVKVTGGRGRITTLSTLVTCFIVGITVGNVLMMAKRVATSKRVTGSILRKAVTSMYKVRSLRVNMFKNVVIKLNITTLRGHFRGVTLPGTLSFFKNSEFIPVVSAVMCVFIKVNVCFI